MTQPSTHVEISAVKSAAAALKAAGEALNAAKGGFTGSAAASLADGDGLPSDKAKSDYRAAYTPVVSAYGKLADSLRNIGAGLDIAAQGYQQTDQSGAGVINGSGG